MLSLTRKPQQKIILYTSDGPITVCLLGKATTRIGLAAPDSVKILRSELIPETKKGNQ